MSSTTEPVRRPEPSARFDEISDAGLRALIVTFYAKVRADPALGPIFNEAIPAQAWPEHLARIHRFWSSVMLGSRTYDGNPVAVHRTIRRMDRALFPLWLALFEQSAAELFAPGPATQLTDKAHRIAASLELALFHRLPRSPGGLPPRPARGP